MPVNSAQESGTTLPETMLVPANVLESQIYEYVSFSPAFIIFIAFALEGNRIRHIPKLCRKTIPVKLLNRGVGEARICGVNLIVVF